MNSSRVLVGLIVAGWLVLLFAVPAYQLFSDPSDGSNRWSWQMYSRRAEIGWIEVTRQDGTSEAIDVTELLIRPRPDVMNRTQVGRNICTVTDEFESVVIYSPDGRDVRLDEC